MLHRTQGCRCCYSATAAAQDSDYPVTCYNTSAQDSQPPTAPAAIDSGHADLTASIPQQQQQQQAKHLEPAASQHASIAEVAESKLFYCANIMSCGVGAEANQIAGRLKTLGGLGEQVTVVGVTCFSKYGLQHGIVFHLIVEQEYCSSRRGVGSYNSGN